MPSPDQGDQIENIKTMQDIFGNRNENVSKQGGQVID